MRRKMYLVLVIILLLATFIHGCSSIKDETDLLDDLKGSNAFSLPDGVEITEFEVIKRLTDEKAKTDKVYVRVNVENTELSQSRAYVMDYTHYNEGWMLDHVEEYWEENYWEVHPKGKPDENVVLEKLIAWSNSRILSDYDWISIEYPVQGPLFFEEGTYDVSFSEGKLGNTYYECVVSVVRPFGYVTSFEDILVTLVIDPYSYTWELVSAESMSLSADWFVARAWSSDEARFYFSSLQLAEDVLVLGDPVAYGYSIYDTELILTIPTFEKIVPAVAIMDYSGFRGDIYGEITLWPNGMWIVDSDGETAEFIGTIESCYAGTKTTEKYTTFGQEWISTIYVEHDLDRFISMIHPVRQSEFDMEAPDWETAPTLDGFGSSNLVLYYVKGYFETEFSNEIMDRLREGGYSTDNVSAIGSLEYEYTLDGEQCRMYTLVIEDGGCIYSFGR